MDKECRKCNETKSIDNFYRKNRTKDGFSNICKSCSKDASKKFITTHDKIINLKFIKK